MTKKVATADFNIGILLVNYNQWELTRKCVASILASSGVNPVIVLIDNNSTYPTPNWVGETPQLMFHKNSTNEGLTAGNNKAFEMISKDNVDYVLILNNDTEVYPDTLLLLGRYLEAHPEAGITSPAIPYAEKR